MNHHRLQHARPTTLHRATHPAHATAQPLQPSIPQATRSRSGEHPALLLVGQHLRSAPPLYRQLNITVTYQAKHKSTQRPSDPPLRFAHFLSPETSKTTLDLSLRKHRGKH
ncbi:unnamed protein product [Vicia faba]|uniref:Uncharacterized protein n=1 Tax=Vicia faba TaxID=3906 RepID=A0AAV0ZJ83_VICFA|nr:unnamed protein product [Vicia faba]